MADQPLLARYSFLPWLRHGLAAGLKRVDAPGATAPRARVEVKLAVTDGEVDQPVELYGPGDVIGLDPRAIVRTDPRHGVLDFEPNYLPLIEFFDEDFPWRYTPAAPAGNRLRPWIALVVLTPEEFTTGHSAAGLGTITLQDAGMLPDPAEIWAWAHVHVYRDVSAADGSPQAAVDAVRGVLERDTTQAISRLICPRRLQQNQTYHAFVIPTFEVGRLAGLRLPVPPTADGLQAAWGMGQAAFPVYFQWQFSTGTLGDFEYLVRRLTPHHADKQVGIRPMDVRRPAPAYNIPGITNPPALGLEGALKSPAAESTVWPTEGRTPFVTALVHLVNLPETLQDADDDPVVSAPLYGRWPVVARLLGAAENPLWIETLNLDPRHRVPAGFGTLVLQRNQEQYMELAWLQAGQVQEANRLLRLAQLARAAGARMVARHLQPLSTHHLLSLSAPVHTRILAPGSAVPTGDRAVAPPTLHRAVADSRLTPALVSPTLRRVARPRGRIMRHLDPTGGRTVGQLVERVNRGDISAAPPRPAPPGQIGLPGIADGLPQPPQSGCLVQPLRPLLRIVLTLLTLLTAVFPGPRNAAACLRAVLSRPEITEPLRESNLTPEAVAQVPPRPGFEVVEAGQPLPAEVRVDGQDSPAAARLRAALADSHTLFEASRQIEDARRPRPALDLAAVRVGLLDQLDPVRTVAARLGTVIHRPDMPGIDALAPIIIGPEIDLPMYRPLKEIAEELLVPNVRLIEPDTVTLLRTNQRFVESYMVGLNHEMARELLWREYPSDLRATVFRQFWDVSGVAPPDPNIDPKTFAEQLKDIRPIHTWPHGNDLGQNNQRAFDGDEYLVLLIRSPLFHKYPDTIVYAVKARWLDKPRTESIFEEILRGPESELDDPQRIDRRIVRTPVFRGELGADIRFFGFELTAEEARGNADRARNQPGWFFVLQEHVGEPRFGLDEPQGVSGSITQWDDLTWGHLRNLGPGRHVMLAAGLSSTPAPGPQGLAWEPGRGADAAGLASILLQTPYKVYIHASEMLPPA